MNKLLDDFKKKRKEINHYFALLQWLNNDNKPYIKYPNSENFRITSDLVSTLKANCYMLLYNLVESSINEGIDTIFNDINQNSITFDKLNNNYKKKWLTYKYELLKMSKDKDKFLKSFAKNSDNVIDELILFSILDYKDKDGNIFSGYKGYLKVLDNNEVSGNLDIEKITELAKEYGFKEPRNKRARHDLRKIKNYRNQLAHGEKTFSEIGRQDFITINELIAIKKRVVLYLFSVLINISKFVRDKGYLNTQNTLPHIINPNE